MKFTNLDTWVRVVEHFGGEVISIPGTETYNGCRWISGENNRMTSDPKFDAYFKEDESFGEINIGE